MQLSQDVFSVRTFRSPSISIKEEEALVIALIAHDSKKELMVQFCIAYCGILSRHDIRATGTTGKLVAEATGLHIQRFLSGSQGGDQQLASSIS